MPETRQELIDNVIATMNNLLDSFAQRDFEVVDGIAHMEDLGRDDKGQHLCLTVDWWMKDTTEKEIK